MMNKSLKIFPIIFMFCMCPVNSLLCYRCVSTHPGCGTPFKWIWYSSVSCPEGDDICVKVTETKDGQEVITRDCLSSLKGFRTDIPADHYEGCRSSTVDLKLGNYVQNSVKEIDIKRNYYDNVTFCFCYFDNWCNTGSHMHVSFYIFMLVISSVLWQLLH